MGAVICGRTQHTSVPHHYSSMCCALLALPICCFIADSPTSVLAPSNLEVHGESGPSLEITVSDDAALPLPRLHNRRQGKKLHLELQQQSPHRQLVPLETHYRCPCLPRPQTCSNSNNPALRPNKSKVNRLSNRLAPVRGCHKRRRTELRLLPSTRTTPRDGSSTR